MVFIHLSISTNGWSAQFNECLFVFQQLFRLYKLKKLTIDDNEIEILPSEIGNLTNLEEFDMSKNG